MLLNLSISNFAIIDRLEVQFDEGFNVLTGETGAGKSIILDAFGLSLGDRARPDLVRAGATEATVEALFDLAGRDDVRQLFAESGFLVDDELVLRRIVQSGGRSRAYVNGSLATLAQLQPLAEQLVTVCGQHEHYSLLQRNVHLVILDRYGALDKQVGAYRESYRAMQTVAQQLDRLQDAERDRQQQLDFLRHQSDEIGMAQLSPDEEGTLLAERLLLQNAERLTGITRGGYEALYDSNGAVCEILSGLKDNLQSVAEIDKELAALGDTVQRCLFDLEDVSAQLRSYLGRITFEPDRLEAIEDRLTVLTRLKRKYAPSLSEILNLKDDFDQKITRLQNAGETREGLADELTSLSDKTGQLGEVLSAARRQVAQKLATTLLTELDDLAMPGASFEVAFSTLSHPGHEGLERAEFMVSLNPGEPLMPLARVASGGELSRLMLALKRLAPDADSVPTVIFDEVDAGIGGAAATAVGRKLQAVSRRSQILCVTHLPQVAAFADHHHRVIKHEIEGRTQTVMERIGGDERVQEMARMLGGAQVTEQTLLHAKELITSSAKGLNSGATSGHQEHL
ncbi:MAG: DNA repair protein RecN [Deltaproteobacteria bacterium]|nr:MAG: DNA repair protein RecN [Deltaproteobacteria bacterium]